MKVINSAAICGREPMIQWQLDGFRELEEALKKLPNQIARRAVVNGLRAGGAVFVRGIKSTAPIRARAQKAKRGGGGGGKPRPRGFLRRQIRQSKAFFEGGKMSVRIGVGAAFYGKFLEFGTAKMKAHPFFRRGMEAAAQAAFVRMRDVIAQAIERYARENRR
jgi:HK97 gp10 family phage protein